MKTRIQLLLAVLRKDFRLLWPLALLTGALRAAWAIPLLIEGTDAINILAQIAIPVLTAFLVLVVFYEDPVVSLTHDWLTRPIPGTTLLAAKTLFLVLTLFVPWILARTIHELVQGYSLGESLLVGIASGADSKQLLPILALMAFAAITSGIRQAFLVALVAVAVVLVANMPRAGVDAGRALLSATGSLWVPTDAAALLLVLGAGLVLWVQYRHRRTWLARSIAGSASVAAYLVLMTMTWQTAFAVQKVLSRNPAAASLVDVGMAEQCFSIRKADGAGFFRYGDQRFGPDPRDEEQLHLAGPGALAFSTRLVPHSMPEGHRLVVNRADLTYQAGGRVVVHAPSRSLLMGMPGGAYGSVFDNRWMLNRNDQQRLAATPGIEAHFVYSLSLLKPVASATIEAGAPRRYLPGIGYCSASVGAGAPQAGANVIEVNCFKPGSQPAQLTAVLEGAPEYQGSNFRATDFTPAALELWSGEYYRTSMFTRQLPLPRVRLAAYEASAHFDREIVVPGVLGGSLASCPLPSGADKIQ